MLNLTSEKVAGIQERAAKATPGEWKFRDSDEATHRMIFDAAGRSAIAAPVTRIHEPGKECVKEMRANAEFIAESRTAVPNLAEDWQQLHAALRRYGWHTTACPCHDPDTDEWFCDCGFSKFMSGER